MAVGVAVAIAAQWVPIQVATPLWMPDPIASSVSALISSLGGRKPQKGLVMQAKNPASWKPGRGRLGPLDPLLGAWAASADSPMGPVRCRRTFSRALNGACVLLDAEWELPGKKYLEHTVYGVGDSGQLAFWSFTSDGKHSLGHLTDAKDVHVSAIAFEAQMPAGLARVIYWPAQDGGIMWAVESRSKKGWNRFTEHHYRRS